MRGDHELLGDPEFRALLARRARWRWGLSVLLIGAYLAWAVGGLYFPALYARPVAGTAIPQGMAAGILIIVLSIVLSVVYVKTVNRIEAGEVAERRQRQ